MTIGELKEAAAMLLSDAGGPIAASDFVVNGYDVAIPLLNQIRRSAEMVHDFNFQRQMLTLTIDSVLGGSIDGAFIQGTDTLVDIKTIIEIGVFDQYGNFVPTEWSTTEAAQEQQRMDNPYWAQPRYPTDGQAACWPAGQPRFLLRGNTVFQWPITSPEGYDVPLGIEAYVFSPEWTFDGDTDIWTEKCSQYLLWQLVVNLNNRFKFYTPRTEGNLPPPQVLASEGLEAFKTWDIFKYEGFRRHGR